ncbi:hypothetical protein [Streptomyces sp. NPDC048508]|uniref:hypothetical protein n=1 Tax=Streptomyces sp. NPDC048508 TaxID=3365561 RepID=UPI003715B225
MGRGLDRRPPGDQRRGKVDPLGPVEGYGTRGRFTFTMGQLRADVDERLKHPASWSPPTTTTPPAPKPTTDQRLSALEKRVTALEKK